MPDRDLKTLASESSLTKTSSRPRAAPPISRACPSFTPLKGFARAARRLQHSAFPASSGLVLKLPSAGRPPFLPPMWFGFLRYTPCTLCTSPILHLSHSIVVTGLRAVFKSSR